MNDIPAIKERQTASEGHAGILSSLRNLEWRLLPMVQTIAAQTGREPGTDPFRGLYVSESDVWRYLREPATQIDPRGSPAEPMAIGSAFEALGELYALSHRELDAVLVALAPDLDLRYERIFAFLQDDVTRRRPSVELVLSLLSGSITDKFDQRSMFSGSGPLVANRLIRLSGDESTPLTRREVSVDPQIGAFLLGEAGLDARLARYTRIVAVTPNGVEADAGLVRLAHLAANRQPPLRLFFQGRDEAEKCATAAALAVCLGQQLLVADIGRAARGTADLEDWLHRLAQDALLRQAMTYFQGLDAITSKEACEIFLGALPTFRGRVILSGASELPTGRVSIAGLISIRFTIPASPDRRRAWHTALQARGIGPHGETLDRLAECFRFNRSEIEDAAETAFNLVNYRDRNAGIEDLFDAARSRSGHQLAALTVKMVPARVWGDIVLPDNAKEQLQEICRRVTLRHHVLGKWGFARKLSGGKGVNALFQGHSGTGKTMAAEVIARDLELDLYKIDLAGVVSKYIGETEKNLDRIFAAAEDASAILLFDEADALFGKRSEVRDSHDRYANLEVSYLLQKMEQHEGVSILATNLRQNLDDAFLRRLAFTVQFPFPDEASRRRIWEGIWPKEAPLAPDVDIAWLAARFMLSGGNIRNAALAAAFLAVNDKSAITQSHVVRAVRAEFQKMGKTLSAVELGLTAGASSAVAA
jgi:hypothetical protein